MKFYMIVPATAYASSSERQLAILRYAEYYASKVGRSCRVNCMGGAIDCRVSS